MFSKSACFNVFLHTNFLNFKITVLCEIDHCFKFRFIFCMLFFCKKKTLSVLNIFIYITKILKNSMMCEVNLKRTDWSTLLKCFFCTNILAISFTVRKSYISFIIIIFSSLQLCLVTHINVRVKSLLSKCSMMTLPLIIMVAIDLRISYT